MKKKTIALALCLMLVAALGGCRDNKPDSDHSTENSSAVADTVNNDEIIEETDATKEIDWKEITADGIDEELLSDNIDVEILETIAAELQALVTEETEDERENPEIVITEGWTRVFKSDRYKKVLDLGTSAMKPLYFILCQSSAAGQYEYICAQALYELSGYDFEWSNAENFIKGFNEQVIKEKQ